jgi:hypothetical protein
VSLAGVADEEFPYIEVCANIIWEFKTFYWDIIHRIHVSVTSLCQLHCDDDKLKSGSTCSNHELRVRVRAKGGLANDFLAGAARLMESTMEK